MVVARVIISRLKSEVAGWYIVGVVKGVVGSGFNIKGRGGMEQASPRAI